MSEENPKPLGAMQDLWLSAACAVLFETSGTFFEVQKPAETSSPRPLCLWTSFHIEGDITGELSFGIPASSRELHSLLPPDLTAAGEGGAWKQLAARIAREWQDLLRVQHGVQCTAVLVADAPGQQESKAPAGIFSILKSDRMALPVFLASDLRVGSTAGAVKDRRPGFWDQFRVPSDMETLLDQQLPKAENLDLLLDIELQASLRFGGREMPLHEILDLGPGNIVALDRPVQAPVELVVGDRIVARGEVVLVDGNYGLRVTEVAEPRKRLETIRCLF